MWPYLWPPMGLLAAPLPMAPSVIRRSGIQEQCPDRWTDIATYRGDWPDWWTDGIGSMPSETDFSFDDATCSLIDSEGPYPLFTPVYERTPVAPANDSDAQLDVRMRMGRKRKGSNVERTPGVFTSGGLIDDGFNRSTYLLRFALEGTSMAEVHLHFRKDAPELEAVFRLHKDSVWDPENLFLALPLAAGPGSQIWLDRAGAAVRPSPDQLPGTLTDWYCLQSGYAVCGDAFGIAVATLDAPLLQLGPLDFGDRELASGEKPKRHPKNAFNYVMTNYWETNFPASLAGFHEFRYRIRWERDYADPKRALAACRSMERECFVFRNGTD